METTEKVLETMRSAGKPVSAGEVATLSGLDRKEVDKAFAQLKKFVAFLTIFCPQRFVLFYFMPIFAPALSKWTSSIFINPLNFFRYG